MLDFEALAGFFAGFLAGFDSLLLELEALAVRLLLPDEDFFELELLDFEAVSPPSFGTRIIAPQALHFTFFPA